MPRKPDAPAAPPRGSRSLVERKRTGDVRHKVTTYLDPAVVVDLRLWAAKHHTTVAGAIAVAVDRLLDEDGAK